MHAGQIKQTRDRGHRPGFGLCSAINHTCQTRMGNRTTAHGARLQGHIQSAVFQTVIAQGLGRLAQSIDFGVGAGVMVADGAVVPCPHHPALEHHDRAHRDFTQPLRRLGLYQSQAHGVFIAKRCLG